VQVESNSVCLAVERPKLATNVRPRPEKWLAAGHNQRGCVETDMQTT
jgi:hypothetical protein